MKLAYIGQNQDSGVYPKKLGVIFFKAKLLNPKHGGLYLEESLSNSRDVEGKSGMNCSDE